ALAFELLLARRVLLLQLDDRVAVVELDEVVGNVAVLLELEGDLRHALSRRNAGDGIAVRVEGGRDFDVRAVRFRAVGRVRLRGVFALVVVAPLRLRSGGKRGDDRGVELRARLP